MVHNLRRPKQGSNITKLNGNKAETILAMLSSGDTSQRGPLTVEGHVARVMKKLLDQVRSVILSHSCLPGRQNQPAFGSLQCCKHQPFSLRTQHIASRECITGLECLLLCLRRHKQCAKTAWEMLSAIVLSPKPLCPSCQMDKWEEKQEAARERKETKQKERQVQLAQKTGKQPPPAAESVAK